MPPSRLPRVQALARARHRPPLPQPAPRFVKASGRPDPAPASQFFPPGKCWSLVHDCRRGLALLTVSTATTRLLVWDPVSRDKRRVPQPPLYAPYANGFAMALLLGRDHPSNGFFRIAAAYVGDDGVAVATVYSSGAGAWGRHVTAKAPAASGSSSMIRRHKPGAAVGGDAAVYWLLNDGRVLSLDLQAGQVLTVLQPRNAPIVLEQNVQLTSTPDGKLGLAAVAGTSLTMWALDHTHDDGGATSSSWTLRRTLPLDTLLPGATDTSWWPRRRRPARDDEIRSRGSKLVLARHDDDDDDGQHELPTPCARVVGVHEDGTAVFLRRACVYFMVCLEPASAPEIHRMFGTSIMKRDFDTVYPYSAPSSSIFSRAISSH